MLMTTSTSHFRGMESKAAVPSPTKPLFDPVVRYTTNASRPGLKTHHLMQNRKSGGLQVSAVCCVRKGKRLTASAVLVFGRYCLQQRACIVDPMVWLSIWSCTRLYVDSPSLFLFFWKKFSTPTQSFSSCLFLPPPHLWCTSCAAMAVRVCFKAWHYASILRLQRPRCLVHR